MATLVSFYLFFLFWSAELTKQIDCYSLLLLQMLWGTLAPTMTASCIDAVSTLANQIIYVYSQTPPVILFPNLLVWIVGLYFIIQGALLLTTTLNQDKEANLQKDKDRTPFFIHRQDVD